jgi:hypothetical protein
MIKEFYTTQLQAGLGLIEETRKLINLWTPGMSATELNRTALESGVFPNITSRRLRNIVVESFKPRFLVNDGAPAKLLKNLDGKLNSREYSQLLFIYTCRANLILTDFVNAIYWDAYGSGKDSISVEDVRRFVKRANEDGKTFKPWSESTITRVSRYLSACCADFGLLESGEKSVRRILPFQIEPSVMAVLAYDLHFSGYGDNQVLSAFEWSLFGMDREDVLNEFKRFALRGWWIVQSAGDVIRIGWQYKSMEELLDGFTQG